MVRFCHIRQKLMNKKAAHAMLYMHCKEYNLVDL